MNYENQLGLPVGSSPSEINRAFRKAAMEIHPDHSSAPEAAEAFARIKEARDQLLREAEREKQGRNDEVVSAATDDAMRAASATAYSSPVTPPAITDDTQSLTPEELAHIQHLDDLASQYARTWSFERRSESEEARKHRQTIETGKRRLDGRY